MSDTCWRCGTNTRGCSMAPDPLVPPDNAGRIDLCIGCASERVQLRDRRPARIVNNEWNTPYPEVDLVSLPW